MSDEYPLFPRLKEEAKKEAEVLFEHFRIRMKKVCDETLGQLYTDVATYIETDSWNNFRNDLMAGFRNYGNRKIQGEYDFKTVREHIFYQFRDEIIKDLDQDNLARIKDLEEQLKRVGEMLEQANRYR